MFCYYVFFWKLYGAAQQTRDIDHCRFNVGPALETAGQHSTDIGLMACVWCCAVKLTEPVVRHVIGQDGISSNNIPKI